MPVGRAFPVALNWDGGFFQGWLAGPHDSLGNGERTGPKSSQGQPG